MTKPIKQIKPLSGKQADAFAKAMMLKEAVASCSLDGQTQCGTIEPEKELTHITSKCKGETWEEADARNNYFIEQGKALANKKIMNIINKDRDNGNIKGEKGFSPALCLSKIIKSLEF